MGSGDIVVGKDFPAQNSASVNPENSAYTGDAVSGHAEDQHCGVMTQQRANNGTLSTPQKFLHLVGYRDPRANPKARPSGGR